MMSEKRFVAEQVDVVNEDETEVWDIVFDTENTYSFMVRDTGTASDLCDLLNEQDDELHKYRAENAELHITILENGKEIDEQQATISKLERKNEQLMMENSALKYALKYVRHIEVDIDVGGVVDDE